MIDELTGDEVMPADPWIELGAAVTAGIAYVGNFGTAVVDSTALGGNHAGVNSQCTQ